VAGRFVLLTDEHTPTALIKALRTRGWTVVRVIERALEHPRNWRKELFTGMLCWPQRHWRRMSIGDVVRFLEALAEQDDPFGLAGFEVIKPSS
jgi:hypothetical protein